MGNFKSRPNSTCSNELLKKILESYNLLEEKLTNDLQLSTETKLNLSDLQNLYILEELPTGPRTTSEAVIDRTENGLTLLHMCCTMNNSFSKKNSKKPIVLHPVDDYNNQDAPDIIQLNKDKGKNLDVDLNRKEVDLCRKDEIISKPNSSKELKEIVQFLLEKNADPAIISKNGFSALHLASYKGDIELVRLFLEKCNHIDHTGAGSVTALHLACLRGHLEVTQVLAQKGSNIEARDAVSFSPLHIACLLGHTEVVGYLLSRGVDVNISGSVGDRPIHLASLGGFYRITQLLIKKGAKVHIRDEEENTAIHYCAREGHNDILNLLLQPQFSTDPYATNIYKDTALHVACYNGRYDCARTLLNYGGPRILLTENLWFETPLHAACTSGLSVELVNYLADQEGIFINHQGHDGHTPLHSACYYGHLNVVQCLLEHGVDINLTARDMDKGEEQTAVTWAYERGHDEIVSMLRYFRRPYSQEDYARGEYHHTSTENLNHSLPSPIGKLRTVIREKYNVLHLRSIIDPKFHLDLSNIEYIENIGSGSFGKVFKGKWKDTLVAVKRYKANVNYGKSDVEMFCREVSILGSLDSPYIVKFVGACLHDPSQFSILTEYVSGGSLFSTLHEDKRSLDKLTRLNIALDVACGMLYLHTLPQPIIHRDLNSHNILLSEEMHARVADFGESRFVTNLYEENMTKQPGNLRWMAPEVFTQCTKYSIKADVFSFGLCFWELLSSELPFAHLKPAAAAADMAYKNSRPPLDLNFPVEITTFLESAWQKVPEQRPDFEQIVDDLKVMHDLQVKKIQDSLNTNGGLMTHNSTHCCGPGCHGHDTMATSEFTNSCSSELSGHVSALRSRWEQEASRGQTAFKATQPTLDELRNRVNNHGYVEGNMYQYRFVPPINKQRKSFLHNDS